MSYANSIFSVLVNYVSTKNKTQNYILGLKVLLYIIFNPGGGFLISSVVLMDSYHIFDRCNIFFIFNDLPNFCLLRNLFIKNNSESN